MTSVTLIGPGAIGCAVAGALVDRDDVDLTIAARTPFEELIVEGLPAPVRARPHVVTDPATVAAPVDIVLLVTKTHQTEAAAPWLSRLCGPSTTVAALQNGIGHVERVGPFVGAASIAPTIIFLPADRIAPGHVRIGLPARLEVPDDDAGRSVRSLFEGTYVDCTTVTDFHTTAWSKLISNCGVGVVATLTRTDNSILADPEVRAIAARVMEEAIEVAMADGAALRPGLAESIIDITIERAGSHISSQTTDRLAGLPTEWDVRQREVIRRADRLAVAVPTLRLLTAIVRAGEPA
jgi:2-dehydropantoate 2-reductase